MPIFQTPRIPDNPFILDIGHDELTASWGEWSGAVAESALYDSPAWSLSRMQELMAARGLATDPYGLGSFYDDQPPEAPFLNAQQWQESPHFRKGLSFPNGVNETVAQLMAERYDYRQRLADIEDRHPQSILRLPAQLGISLATSMLDPLNVASAFVPVVGEARYASMLAKVGKWPARLATGAIEGAVGQAMVEPITAAARMQEQADYTMLDALVNIGFGTVFGAGLHSLTGAVADVIEWRKGKVAKGKGGEGEPLVIEKTAPEIVAEHPPELQEASLKIAVGQMADGREADVEGLKRIGEPEQNYQPRDILRTLSDEARTTGQPEISTYIDERVRGYQEPDVNPVKFMQDVDKQITEQFQGLRENYALTEQEISLLDGLHEEMQAVTTFEKIANAAADCLIRKG